MKSSIRTHSGSTLIAAMIMIGVTSVVVAAYYTSLIGKYRSVKQAANWHASLHGADAGAAYAVYLLNQMAAANPDPNSYPWVTSAAGTTDNWKFFNPDGSAVTNPKGQAGTLNGSNLTRVLAATQNPDLGGPDKVKVTEIAVDVYTRNAASTPWFRIRSSARADLPGRYTPTSKLDAELRRMKLGGKNGNTLDPHVSRTVEVILRPKYRFPRAISTLQGLSLANSSKWLLDSFDSSDSSKSDPGTAAGGVYPSADSKKQKNGSIATMKPLPTGVLYGALIDGNGATVEGDVSTAGGDNPNTATHENVSGSSGMDQRRIDSDFDEEFPAIAKPNWTVFDPAPTGKTNFLTSTDPANPQRYIVNGGLGAFSIVDPNSVKPKPKTPVKGYVEILVNGNLDIGNGNSAVITIPPSVTATIYVDGNVAFGNGSVNSDASSSQVASHLTIYGVSTAPSPTYEVSGNPVQILSFYGPNYDITFSGTAVTIGAVVGKSFKINGGGTGGFHYDESLGKQGSVSSWGVVSYFEDTRGDVK